MSQVEDITLDAAYPEDEVEAETTETVEATEETTEETETVSEETTEETEEETKESTTDSKKDEWTLTAVMDEREKRQAFQKENEELKKQLADKEEEPGVSIFDNEAEWQAAQIEAVEQRIQEIRLIDQRAYAVRDYDEAKVAAAEAWTETEGIKSPFVLDAINSSDLKYHKAIELMEAESNRQDPEKFAASIESKVMEKLEASGWTPPDSESKTTEPITPSLASKRSAGEKKQASENFEDILGA